MDMDGEFSPEEWHQTFITLKSPEEWDQPFKKRKSQSATSESMGSASKKSQDQGMGVSKNFWRLNPDEFRKGLSKCDFQAFASSENGETEATTSQAKHVDYYQWQGVMRKADVDRRFRLNHDKL